MKNRVELYEQVRYVASPEAQVELVVANTRLVLQRGRVVPFRFLSILRYVGVRLLGFYRRMRGV